MPATAGVLSQFTYGTQRQAFLQVRGVDFLQTVIHMGCDRSGEIGSHGDAARQRRLVLRKRWGRCRTSVFRKNRMSGRSCEKTSLSTEMTP